MSKDHNKKIEAVPPAEDIRGQSPPRERPDTTVRKQPPPAQPPPKKK